MSNLLLQPDLSGNGPIHDVTPASAGWSHVGFGLHDLAAGRSVGSDGTVNEICLVLLSGSVRIIAGDLDTGMLQGRASVFDKVAPHAVYVPMKTAWRVEAGSDSELAVCRAPGTEGKLPPRLIGSQNMPLETRGTGSNVRHVCNILPETEPADSLLVVEVITPAGNWSSYPPHKHDTESVSSARPGPTHHWSFSFIDASSPAARRASCAASSFSDAGLARGPCQQWRSRALSSSSTCLIRSNIN